MSGSIDIVGNHDPTDLYGFQNLETVDNLRITDNDILTRLDFWSLTSAVDILILSNDRLASIAGLENLCAVSGRLQIVNNPSLCTSEAESLRDQIESCESGGLDGSFTISENSTSDE